MILSGVPIHGGDLHYLDVHKCQLSRHQWIFTSFVRLQCGTFCSLLCLIVKDTIQHCFAISYLLTYLLAWR